MADSALSPEARILQELAWVRDLARQLLRDPNQADDVAQDVWLAVKARPPVEPAGGLRAWLAVVVRNQVRRLARTQRRRIARENAVATIKVAEDPANVVERASLHREVTVMVMELEEPYRSALLLRFLDGLQAPEVARRQGISHDAARQRISRGLQLLRTRLGRGHPGGFAAWSLAWTQQLQPTASAGVVASAFLLPALLLMKLTWIVLGVASISLLAWMLWPSALAPSTSPSMVLADAVGKAGAGTDNDAGAVVASRAPATVAKVIEVVDGELRAQTGVAVLALHVGELVQSATTDAAGQAEFSPSTTADEFVLVAVGTLPQRVPAIAGTNTQRIVQATASAVAGTVRGEAVAQRVVLRLEHDVVEACWQGLGPQALQALAKLGATPIALECPVQSDLRFAFRGLAPTWSGALTAGAWTIAEPTRRGAVEKGRTLLLLEPVQDLLLDLQSPTWIRGRVLAGGAPAHGLLVSLVSAASQTDGNGLSVVTALDGRFVVGLPGEAVTAAMLRGLLSVATPAGNTLSEQSIQVPAGTVDHDIGDIVLDGSLRVHVVDQHGTNVAGARVSVTTKDTLGVSMATGATGDAELVALPTGASRVVVQAPGHARVSVAIPAERSLTVTLRAANELVVQVTDAAGKPTRRGSLRVQADRLPFAVPMEAAAQVAGEQAFRADFDLDRDGRVALNDLEAGVMLKLTVLDAASQSVGGLEVVTPPPLRRDLVTVATTIADATQSTPKLRCLVRDESGRPLPRVRVHLEASGYFSYGRTDANGSFAFDAVQQPLTDTHLEVLHPGFVPHIQNGMAIAPSDATLEIVLQRGRPVVAHLLQQNGQPVTASYVSLANGRTAFGTLSSPGTYTFENVARTAGKLQVVLAGGREFTAPVDANAEQVDLRLPNLATITITIANTIGVTSGKVTNLVITPIEPVGNADRVSVRPEHFAGGPLSLMLAPGRYQLQLEQRTVGRRNKLELLGEPRQIEVAGGALLGLVLP